MVHNKKSQEAFILEASKKHNNFYDYSDSVYIDYSTKLKIVCPLHGEFNQRAGNHLKGIGCMLCGREKTASARRLTLATFLERAKKIHGDKYNYAKVKYLNNSTKVEIVCAIHGTFKQNPDKHLGGNGCMKCGHKATQVYALKNSGGYKDSVWAERGIKAKDFNSYKVYLVGLKNDKEEFYKIGKTFNSVDRRLRNLKGIYSLQIIEVLEYENGLEACEAERALHKANTEHRYKPLTKFHGCNECFLPTEKIIFKNFI